MADIDAYNYVFPGFLIPVPTQLSYQSNWLLFSHASGEWQKTTWKKVCQNHVLNPLPAVKEFNTVPIEITTPKAFADILKVAQMTEYVLGEIETC